MERERQVHERADLRLDAAALERDILAQWQPFVEDGALTLPLGVAVVTARSVDERC